MTVRGGRHARLIGVLLALLLLAGCSPPEREPGLFGRSTPIPSHPPAGRSQGSTPAPAPSGSPATIPGPDLPTVGSRLWTTADGTKITFRIAVHALRRIRGGTVLDWSVTPLPGEGLAAGERVPASVELGALGDPRTFRLIDTGAGRIYPPLVGIDSLGCLCSNPPGTQYDGSALAIALRAGSTQLHQLVFPPLPAGTRPVEVDIGSVALFQSVPLADRGRVAERHAGGDDNGSDTGGEPVIRWTPAFRYRGGQPLRIGIMAVEAGPSATSLVWSIWSIGSGHGLGAPGAPPITDTADVRRHRDLASGPRLRLSSEAGHARTLTVWRQGRGGPALATSLTGWAPELSKARRTVTVVSIFPALPIHASSVDVVLPGLATVERVPVTRIVAPRTEEVAGVTRTWVASEPYRRLPWTGVDWPTPLPQASMLAHFRARSWPLS